ncbi:MAG: NUDIX hydrolase [Bacilli bacterium]
MRDYIRTMRQFIGHETLLTVGCGAIIENEAGEILLQHRADGHVWGIPGGLMEIGETFEDAVCREVLEETGVQLAETSLFGLYSGDMGFATYPNGDRVYSLQVIFFSKKWLGVVKQNEESLRLAWFSRDTLPTNLNPCQAPYILDWRERVLTPVIR